MSLFPTTADPLVDGAKMSIGGSTVGGIKQTALHGFRGRQIQKHHARFFVAVALAPERCEAATIRADANL